MGRPSTGKTETLILRCSRELIALIDLCASREADLPNRSEMARRLIEAEVTRRLVDDAHAALGKAKARS